MIHAWKYEIWLAIFKFSLYWESVFVRLRDKSQREKMNLVAQVPENWETSRSW